ncbi:MULTISPECIES: hypothetical protein [Rhodopseudomonas]|uniref:Uncharacterized protein n=1 Tax=Rhodopseudomonas palustris TaxID=1076 RepID=A0A0D7F461_RHOPL|nr:MULTISPECIES: hypothetical protein [Rhodopseudomonas]KIZ47843.1 hypothetical protein OO17_02180 [Rhodopseudomonas palustris]MDF3811046.1 hypothetical protein [Rhodopseudomonas sp. BAL398]WOK15942.1 hypothetical protein RBJ75_17415 [Rhodopseudomonas sp. BAL398]
MSTLKLADVVPTTQGPEVTGLSLDSFRMQMRRDPNAPKPFKIGFQNFYVRAELVRWAKGRKAASIARCTK